MEEQRFADILRLCFCLRKTLNKKEQRNENFEKK